MLALAPSFIGLRLSGKKNTPAQSLNRILPSPGELELHGSARKVPHRDRKLLSRSVDSHLAGEVAARSVCMLLASAASQSVA